MASVIFQEFEIDPDLITEQKAEVENKVRIYLNFSVSLLMTQTIFS